jgi:hypothetical protein
MMVIHPYRDEMGWWLFDDESKNLEAEALVQGIPEIIETILGILNIPEDRVSFLFSRTGFPGYHAVLKWEKEEFNGNWYRLESSLLPEGFKMEGWLCPALLKYFDEAPKEIYVKLIENKKRHPKYTFTKPKGDLEEL